MPNTYTQIHIHCIFAVKYRLALIAKEWKDRLHQYITGIVQNHEHKMISINSMPDHLHMLFGMRPTQSLSNLMQIVKGDSSEWLNDQKITPVTFRWQEGYGAFSIGVSGIDDTTKYIQNQAEHHRNVTFKEELETFLKKHAMEYVEQDLD